MNTAESKQKATLSHVEQTALVLLGMGEDAAAKVLRNFTRDETQRVTKAMAKLSGIKVIVPTALSSTSLKTFVNTVASVERQKSIYRTHCVKRWVMT